MILILTANGHVNWDNTRNRLTTSQKFAEGSDNFGIGEEHTATCPGCGRILPTAVMHLDHILSQAEHTQRIMTPGTPVTLLDFAPPHDISVRYAGEFTGGTLKISNVGTGKPTSRQKNIPYFRAIGEPHKLINTHDAWRNDISNLQFLCMCCNTSKRERLFSVVFPNRQPKPILL